MKLRTRNNSLRLRLNQEDLQVLKEERKITEVIHFGPGNKPLIYSLCWERYAERISAEFNGHEILVMIPDNVAYDWVNTDQVSINFEQDNGTGMPLQILIEKDFKCLKERVGEDEHKNFPNPLTNEE